MQMHPTPYPDVNEILNFLLTKCKEVLQDQFVGMYLYGSLAIGDFDQHSDIDVLVVTYAEISNDLFEALKGMHERITKTDSPWADQLEDSYIPQNALRRFDPASKLHPHIDRGKGKVLHLTSHESDWIIQRWTLRENGITITGPDRISLIDPVSQEDLRQAIFDDIHNWFEHFLDDPHLLQNLGYQTYVVLTLCRSLHTYEHGRIVSKPVAAQWAQENLGSRWAPFIERAWIGRQNPELEAQPEDIYGTLDLIRFTRQRIEPTPHPDVNKVLIILLSNAKEILGDQFVGMYLYGSLSSGDFNPETSDIDFLIVTTDQLSDETVTKLETMHKHIWESGIKWADKLEGAYIPGKDIRCHDSNNPPCPTINEGKFYLGGLGSDWIVQRHVVREFGVVLEGPDPKTLIDPVSPEEIRRAVLETLHEWWFPMLQDPSWLQNHGSNYHGYAIITMCRVLHALRHGTVASKPVAVRWAKENLGNQWHPLIDQAVASQYGKHSIFLNETLQFIRFTMEQINHERRPLSHHRPQ